MNIIEAAEAAKSGKKVELCGSIAYWDGSQLRWKITDMRVSVATETISNDWKIVQEPLKTYPFSEALKMMSNGTWMRHGEDVCIKAKINGIWHTINTANGGVSFGSALFSDYAVEKPIWREVEPPKPKRYIVNKRGAEAFSRNNVCEGDIGEVLEVGDGGVLLRNKTWKWSILFPLEAVIPCW